MDETPCLPKLLVGPWARCVRDVVEVAGRCHHVVGCPRETQHVKSPHVAIVISLGGALPLDLLPSPLELGVVGIEVGFLGLEALGLHL